MFGRFPVFFVLGHPRRNLFGVGGRELFVEITDEQGFDFGYFHEFGFCYNDYSAAQVPKRNSNFFQLFCKFFLFRLLAPPVSGIFSVPEGSARGGLPLGGWLAGGTMRRYRDADFRPQSDGFRGEGCSVVCIARPFYIKTAVFVPFFCFLGADLALFWRYQSTIWAFLAESFGHCLGVPIYLLILNHAQK